MSRLHVGMPLTKLLLRLTDQIFSVEITFPSQALGTVQVRNVPESWVNNCTVVSVRSTILKCFFFLCCVEGSRKRKAATSCVT